MDKQERNNYDITIIIHFSRHNSKKNVYACEQNITEHHKTNPKTNHQHLMCQLFIFLSMSVCVCMCLFCPPLRSQCELLLAE